MKQYIKTRISTRTYLDKKLSDNHLKKIHDYLNTEANIIGIYGNSIKLKLINATEDLKNGKIGTYGVIKNAPLYLISTCDNTREALLDVGYVFEKFVIFLESLDIGTCWLGGTFNRNLLLKNMDIPEDHIIPAVSPLGYKAEKTSIIDKMFRRMSKSRTRKDFDSIFFQDDFTNPVRDKNLRTLLEYVRIAPSASNKQPWRIVVKDNYAHFYIEETPNYVGNTKFGYYMQLLDIGIAIAHYEIAWDKKMEFKYDNPNLKLPNEYTEYIVSSNLV